MGEVDKKGKEAEALYQKRLEVAQKVHPKVNIVMDVLPEEAN